MVKRVRAIYERWPNFRERLPEVRAVLQNTSVPERLQKLGFVFELAP